MQMIGICCTTSYACTAVKDWKSHAVQVIPAVRTGYITRTSLQVLMQAGAAYVGQEAQEVYPILTSGPECHFYNLNQVLRHTVREEDAIDEREFLPALGLFFKKLEEDVNRHLLQGNIRYFTITVPDVYFENSREILQKGLATAGLPGRIIPYSRLLSKRVTGSPKKRALLINQTSEGVNGYLFSGDGMEEVSLVFDFKTGSILAEIAKILYEQIVDLDFGDTRFQDFLCRRIYNIAEKILVQYMDNKSQNGNLMYPVSLYDKTYYLQIKISVLIQNMEKRLEQMLDMLNVLMGEYQIKEVFWISEQEESSLWLEELKRHCFQVSWHVVEPEDLAQLAVYQPSDLELVRSNIRKVSSLLSTIHLINAQDKSIILSLKKGTPLPASCKGVMALQPGLADPVFELVEEDIDGQRNLFGVIHLRDVEQTNGDHHEVQMKVSKDGKLDFDVHEILSGKKQRHAIQVDAGIASLQVAASRYAIKDIVIVNSTNELNLSLYRF